VRLVFDASEGDARHQGGQHALDRAAVGCVEAFENDEPEDERGAEQHEQASQHSLTIDPGSRQTEELHEEEYGKDEVQQPSLGHHEVHGLRRCREQGEKHYRSGEVFDRRTIRAQQRAGIHHSRTDDRTDQDDGQDDRAEVCGYEANRVGDTKPGQERDGQEDRGENERFADCRHLR
jgi:hypothetical protein